MATPQSYLACAPQGAGLLCAVVYLERDADVYGWWVGAKNSGANSAFFKLEDFFTPKEAAFYATAGSDIYGGWRYCYSSDEPELDRPVAVSDEICHELDRLQDGFALEWLFFRDAADAEEELDAYGKLGVAVGQANIKSRKLNKLDAHEAVWTYHSHELDWDIIEYLASRWPLDYRAG